MAQDPHDLGDADRVKRLDVAGDRARRPDAQHADDGLLDFLEHLVVTARAPVFVMALARPELLQRRPSLGGPPTFSPRGLPSEPTRPAMPWMRSVSA